MIRSEPLHPHQPLNTMKYSIMLVMALLMLGPGDGKKKGRQGNAQYAQEQYADAAATYRDGIKSVQEDGPGAVHSGLLNNLGAALYRGGDAEQAGIAFSSAARMATSPDDLVRASYNAGNAAFDTEQLDQSLEHYRRALLSDPSNSDAKFNYEFVKRKLEEQQEQQQDQQQENEDNEEQNQDEQQNQDGEQDDQQQDEQQQDQQQQNSDDESQQDQQEQREQDQQEKEDPTQLSEEEAQRILQALENEEEQLLRQVQKMKTRPRRVEKDW